jgi:hypothetical protein
LPRSAWVLSSTRVKSRRASNNPGWIQRQAGRTGGRRGLARSTAAAVLVKRAFGPAALHPVEEQLVLAQPLAGLQDRDRASRQAPASLAHGGPAASTAGNGRP